MSYSFNIEALAAMERENVRSYVPCVVHGIPQEWSVCCWLADALATSLASECCATSKADALPLLSRLNGLLFSLVLQTAKTAVPSVLRSALARLVTRTTRKIQQAVRCVGGSGGAPPPADQEHWRLLGITNTPADKVRQLVREVVQLHEREYTHSLPSAYSQDLYEMVATLLGAIVPLTNSKGSSGAGSLTLVPNANTLLPGEPLQPWL